VEGNIKETEKPHFEPRGFEANTSNTAWPSLQVVVMNTLALRGTPAAVEAVRRIDEKVPDERLKRVLQVAQEVTREKTWAPLSPAEFIDFVAGPRGSHTRPETEKTPVDVSSHARRFKRTGEVWSLQYEGTSALVRHSIGMAYCEHLLRSPDRLFGCRELQAAVGENPDRRKSVDKDDRDALTVAAPVRYEVLDDKARREYKERLSSIKSELEQTERDNNSARREQLSKEKQALIEELKRATALRGRSRAFAGDDERARKAVARAVGTALNKIANHHPEMGNHLRERIERGAQCCYRGDGISWEV
jgi:hypothetical protein